MRDKNPAHFLEELKILNPVEVIAVGVDSERAWSPSELAAQWAPSGVPVREAARWPDAHRLLKSAAQPEELLIVTGSLYLAGEARKTLKSS